MWKGGITAQIDGNDDTGQPQGLPRQNARRETDEIGETQFGQPQGLPRREPRREARRVTLGDIVGAYKSLVANECLKTYKLRNETMGKLWQRNYYEHVIRSERELNQIGEYILYNPDNWDEDDEYGKK